jgi:hypothetical protein
MRFAFILAGLFITAPASAQTYDYTARTEAPVRQSGEVRAGALTWRCSGQACTISGPWPNPGEGACAALASQVGRISEYGHPGRRLDAAALGRCNRNVAAAPMLQVRPQVLTPRTVTPSVPLQQVQRPAPRQQMQAVTAMNYTAPRITRQTLAVEPRPTGRLWAVRTGGGDGDFGGNGPNVSLGAEVYARDHCLRARINMTARENRSDWTEGAVEEDIQIWCNPDGGAIERILDPTRATASYADTDWEIDTVVPGLGEVDPRRSFPVPDGPVRAFMVMGDTNGEEAGTRTGVRAFYAPLTVTLTPTAASARASDFDPDVFLNVPTGDFVNRLSGGNSCGPQAGSRLLRFYGVPTTYEQFKRRVQSSGNAVSDQSLGTPPGTLRDRINELAPGFVHEVLPLENPTRNAAALQRIRDLLDAGRPVIVLVSWGNQLADGIISPHDAAATSHWIVVRGYDSRARTFHVVDNGHGEQWSYAYMESMMDYGQDAQYEALLAMFNVPKGSIIYRR